MPDAKNHDRVKVLLQREVDNMRKTGTTMGVVDNTATSTTSLRINGDLNTPFTFEFDESSGIAPVTFASGTAIGGGDDASEGLASLIEFMESC